MHKTLGNAYILVNENGLMKRLSFWFIRNYFSRFHDYKSRQSENKIRIVPFNALKHRVAIAILSLL